MDNNSLGFIIWTVVAMGVGGLGVYLLLKSIQSQRASKDSLTWPYAAGQITQMSVKVDGDSESGKYRYRPVVNYVYDVSGKIFEGKQINFGRGPIFNSQQEAEQFLANYPPEGEVNVFYNPAQPQQSVLCRELYGHKTNLITGWVLIVVMVQMFVALIFIMRLF